MFRKQKEAFAFDHIAMGVVRGMTHEETLSYEFQEAFFFTLPFEHDESMESQEEAARLT